MHRRLLAVSLLSLSVCRGESPLPARVVVPAATLGETLPRTSSEHAPSSVAHALPLVPVNGADAVSAGAVALAHLGGRTLAFVADADDRAILSYDVDSRALLASTPLGARPSAVLVTPAGRVVALGADDARVHLLALVAVGASMVEERAIDVPDEPVSAALTAGGTTLLVASRWGHALSLVPLATLEAPRVVDLPRDPSAVVASFDGKRAIVTHAAGSRLSVVELERGAPHTASLDRSFQQEVGFGWMPMPMQMDEGGNAVARKRKFETVTLRIDQAFALARLGDGRVLAPDVAVDTGAEARSSGYGASQAVATPAVTALTAGWDGSAPPGGKRVFGSRCLLPRGAAIDAQGRLLVACEGNARIASVRIRDEKMTPGPEVRVPAGPVGLAVDEGGRSALVWSAFDRVVSVLSLGDAPKVVAKTTVPRALPAPSEEVLRGRSLFYASFEARVSTDGRGCASCHPDGRDDGLSWSTPGGKRQTPMLVERIDGTAPYGWDGAGADFAHHMVHTTARLGGTGLSKRDVADLSAYLATLRVPASPHGRDETLVVRGEAIFHSEQAECASCHGGAVLTDGDAHDVQSGARGRRRAFDTPSLHLLAGSAPYFHDGRYATLADLVAGSDGAMGHTGQLSRDDRAALVAYLETL